MNPYNGTNEPSILILDNCSRSSNFTKGLWNICDFLPPYSPDLNPIELTISCIKHYLQEHQEIIQAANNLSDVIKSVLQ